MSLNYKALKEYKIGGSSGGGDWFRPKPNEDGSSRRYTFRLLATPGYELPFFDTTIHYFRAEGSFTSGACPRVTGDFCIACDMFFKLRLLHPFKGDNNKNMKILRKINPTTRVYANVIPRGVDRVQVWSMPYTVANDLRNALLTYLEDEIDLTDPENGRDLVLPVGKQGAVTKYEGVTVRPKASEVGVEDWEAQCHDLKEKAHGRMFSTDEVEEHVGACLGDSAADFFNLYKSATEVDKASKKEKDDGEIGEEV